MRQYAINKPAVFAVFTLADNSSASFAEKLLALGVGDRATARPLAIEWASIKYKAPIKAGQRGMTFTKRGTAAEQAVTRVLQVCFPGADIKPKASSNDKTDPVESLLKKFAKLSKAEQRRFKASI